MQKKAKTILVTLGTVLVLGLFIGCGGRSGEKEYDKAVAALKKGNLVRARTLFENSIRKTSNTEDKSVTLNQLGLVLWELGETDAAAEAFEQSCNLAESISGANVNAGIALFHSGKFDEAEMALNNVLGDTPQNTTARTLLGLIEMKKNNWAGASTELSKTLNISPNNPAAQNAMALAELHQNRNADAATKRLNLIVTTHPDYAPAAYNLAVIYDLWQKNKPLAKEAYQHYLNISGGQGSHDEKANRALARLSGKPTRPTQPNPAAAARHIAEGSSLHAAKKYKEALLHYQKAIQLNPKQKNAYYNMSLAYFAIENYQEAARACTAAIKLDPAFTDAHYMLALAYYKQKMWTEAERAARDLKKTDPSRGKQMLRYISSARKVG